jgi:hypothetical protein
MKCHVCQYRQSSTVVFRVHHYICRYTSNACYLHYDTSIELFFPPFVFELNPLKELGYGSHHSFAYCWPSPADLENFASFYIGLLHDRYIMKMLTCSKNMLKMKGEFVSNSWEHYYIWSQL